MKQLNRQIFASFLLIAGLFAACPAMAQSSSIPYFEIDSIHIPRIDVEGYGSLTIVLKLEDEVALTFSVSEAVDADTNLTPGATFDLDTTILDIPLVKVDSDYYDVEMVLIPGDLFQITFADFASLPGQQEFNTQCASCHGVDGAGGAVAVSLINCANCSGQDVLSNYINNVMPLGAPGNCVGSCASDIADYILTVFSASTSTMALQALEAIEVMPLTDTLRKASLQLVGRLPTSSEEALVASAGETGLRQALDGMMDEEAFYDRLGEIFNDFLHTNRYLAANGPAEQAINLMPRFLPDKRWFDDGSGPPYDAEFLSNRITTNDSVAAEPLQLVNYVVKNDLPMTEILTADYFMVNPYSAKSWSLFDELPFQDEWDPDEWLPTQYDEIPHAGLLTSLMFLNRYPTSETNRNRGRSRVVYDLFLDVDILALDGERPDGEAVDITSPAPTMENDDCVICHGLLDPVASSFENWDLRGRYIPFLPWYDDMFQAGFAGVDRPASEEPTSLQWLASQMAVDPRFDDAMLRIVYQGLTGSEPLSPPGEFS
ncbi:MAG: c-type cytochrome, partial [Gammaproteobacteria bacterium]